MPAVTTAEGTEVGHRVTGSGPGPPLVHGSTGDAASGIAGSRCAELDSGHNVLLERPRRLAELITDFPD
ncbi:hypothetical protein [Streptomyces sp. NPDC059894]|uniref:hypothetical protein n=1 Tax=unclassified Streptomyces TaxID=2593676 RepID=UPI00366A2062